MSEEAKENMVILQMESAKFMGHKASSFLESGHVFGPLLEYGESEGQSEAPESPFEEAPEGDV